MIMPKEPINQDLTHINHHTPEKTRNLQSFESPIIDSNIFQCNTPKCNQISTPTLNTQNVTLVSQMESANESISEQPINEDSITDETHVHSRRFTQIS